MVAPPPRAREADPWEDPAKPPVAADDLGDGVWATWDSVFNREPGRPMVWHWCDRSVDGGPPMWRLAGVGAHTLVEREPLHLEPSLYWPGCCGKHGWVRQGRWQPA